MIGALTVQGYINPVIAYVIFVTMDVLGDALYYCFGRVGFLGGKFLIKESWRKTLSRLNGELEKNIVKALFIGKILAIGSKPIIVAAGIAKMPLRKFLSITVPCTLVLFLLYMSAGHFLGEWILK